MKRNHILTLILALALAALTLTGCGKSEFGVITNSEKRMVLSAENAGKDAVVTVGALEVTEGEAIDISADLTEGEIRVEILPASEEQSMEEAPELTGDAVITANLKADESASGTVEPGTYLLKAICLERATGTVQVEVLPAA